MSKKSISRTVILLAVLVLCTAIGTFYYAKLELQERNSKYDLFSLIPEEANAVIEVNNIHSLLQELHFTAFSDSYKRQRLSDLVYLLDENHGTNPQKAHGFSGEINHLLISFHAPSDSVDQVMYGHLSNDDGNFIKALLQQSNNQNTFQKVVEYKGEEIQIYPVDNSRFLACYLKDGFYAISFQKRLIEKVIDTYLEQSPSIEKDSIFHSLTVQKKPTNSFYLYTRCQPLSNWAEFNIRIHNQSIYMSGSCLASSDSSFAALITEGKKVSLIAPQLLPEKTMLFFQTAISDSTTILPYFKSETLSPTSSYSLCDFMDENTQGEICNIKFEGNDTNRLSQVLLIPLIQPFNEASLQWRNFLQPAYQSKYINGKYYPFYNMPKEDILNKFLLVSPNSQENKLYAIPFDRQLLLSNNIEDIVDYIAAETIQTRKEISFQEELTDLVQEPNFTLFADLEHLLEYPQGYAEYIPSFFLKHQDLFQHFTFSLQLIKGIDHINANVILTYKEE